MLSIVIPAHNEEALLGETIGALETARAALATERDEPSELIVVDDDSTDGTAALAASRGAAVVGVAHRKISAARNAGAAQANGDLLVFVDADTIVPAETLIAAVAVMRDGAVGGGARIRFDRPIPLWASMLEPVAALGYRVIGLTSGCFTFCRRDVFDTVGGYDEELVAAEEGALAMAMRKHGRVVVLREPVVTSGRKLRTYSFREIAGILGGAIIRGRRGFRNREAWEILYGEERTDPKQSEAP
jgi:glycosyltransferase involved in cell wall biosynthesis